jgi:arylsulfatase A-like enzyme
MKADAWEGGHRIPFIVRWPGKVKAGSVSKKTTTLTNLLATCADVLGVELTNSEDSYSIFSEITGQKSAEENPVPVIHHSSKGYFAIRDGDWKLIDKLGSGGFSSPRFEEPVPGGPEGQLYNLKSDPSETTNLYLEKPEIVDMLKKKLKKIKEK